MFAKVNVFIYIKNIMTEFCIKNYLVVCFFEAYRCNMYYINNEYQTTFIYKDVDELL